MEYNCEICKKQAEFMCNGCEKVYYCSRECQTKHWTNHINNCVKDKKCEPKQKNKKEKKCNKNKKTKETCKETCKEEESTYEVKIKNYNPTKEEFEKLSPEEKKAIRKYRKEEKKRLKKEKSRKRREHQERLKRQKERPSVNWDERFELKKRYGDLPIMMSKFEKKLEFLKISEIDEKQVGKTISIRGRVHTKREKSKDMIFLVIRNGYFSVQVVVVTSQDKKTIPRKMVQYTKKLTKESIVDIIGKVVLVKDPTNTSQSKVEINCEYIYCFSSAEFCPLLIEDAMKSEEELLKIIQSKQKPNEKEKKTEGVTREVRLNNRYLDLRVPSHKAIFRIQSHVGMFFRQHLYTKGFHEIHSPKMISAASEGGADVFKVDYFDKFAYLAQSPQLYKQMAIMCDFDRVFEVGPVFRAENSHTNRHLTEFTGLDIEMKIENHYHEILDVLDELFVSIFEGINKKCKKELEIIRKQYNFVDLKYNKNGKNLRLNYPQVIKLLRESGIEINDLEDISTEQEKKLGVIVKEKYNTDFYIVDKFPMGKRPFYTMPDPNDPNYSNSYDVFIRGEEVTSGSQRIHDPNMLLEKAKKKGVDLQPIIDYVNSFKYGAWSHGGAGIGLERVVMLFLGLPNIRKCTMFPRDPKRLTP